MLGSKNDFFLNTPSELVRSRYDMLEVLDLLNRSDEDKILYLDAFNYFVDNPREFDGATVMRDLFVIRYPDRKLDIDAMLHDYEYINGANKSFKLKHKADFRYFNNMRRNGKGVQLFRLSALLITGIIFVPYNKFLKKKIMPAVPKESLAKDE